MLKSDATLQAKDAACAQLKRIGTAQSIPALAALLSDPDLSHSARYALESMSFSEAGRALGEALSKTEGPIQSGILESLGTRREAAAVSAIMPLLNGANADVAAAAAYALGKIGGKQAESGLKDALFIHKVRDAAVRAAIFDALLAIAHQKLSSGARDEASRLFTLLWGDRNLAVPAHVRQAARRGMIRTAGDDALKMLIADIRYDGHVEQAAALQLARELEGPGVTNALCELLPTVPLPAQLSLIEALRQRGDPAAASALITIADKPALRVPALGALGDLGGPESVPCLVRAAAMPDAETRKAARAALLDLRRGKVTEALLATLADDKSDAAQEAVRALAGRGDQTAVPRLLELAATGPDSSRKAAFNALGQLAGPSTVPQLVKSVVDARDAATRELASDALRSACGRLRAKVDAGVIASAMTGAPGIEARAALLQSAGSLTDPRIRAALRAALIEADPALRKAASTALTDTLDPELLPDLQALAQGSSEPVARLLAVRGALRLATEPNAELEAARRLQALRQIQPLIDRSEEKYLLLSGLANLPDPQALEVAQKYLDDPAACNEAAQAITRLSSALAATHAEPVRAALKKVVASGAEPAQRFNAAVGLKLLESMTGYITAWEVAGPFTQAGKDARALFDIAFPPESPDAQGIAWRPLAAGTLAGKPQVLDLYKPLGGALSCVAYVRARVVAEKERPARLELGFDDGIKAWLNGEQVYADNAIGALRVGAGVANVKLKKGENTLLLKITQNNMMWEFCARLAEPGAPPPQPLAPAAKAGKKAGKKKSAKKAAGAPPAPAVFKEPNAPQAPSPVPFRRMQLDAAFRSEGVAVADFNKDGAMDIATGTMIYLGPGWKPQPMGAAPKEYPREKYSQEFYCWAEDIDRDGWPDLIVTAFPGQATRWMRNPGQAGGPWKEFPAVAKTGNESPDWTDVDGDGTRELVFISEQGMALARPGADPTQPWPIQPIASPGDPRPGHGLGVGDINGDGRKDIVIPEGWWEAPAEPGHVPWAFHAARLNEIPPAQLCVYDCDGDGDADVLSSGAHRYGLWWCEQTPQGWQLHEIDHAVSQLHALHLADLNGDGLADIVTGKRFWAHMLHDDGINDPAVLSWYELRRQDGKPHWIRHDLDQDSGVGLHVQITDVNGDGLLDIAASHKKGVYLFLQEKKP